MTSSPRPRRHEWDYLRIVAYADGKSWTRGKYQVVEGQFRQTTVELCACRRCGLTVAVNSRAMAQRVANVERLDCDNLVIREVMES